MKGLWRSLPAVVAASIAIFLVTGCLGPKVLKERSDHVPAPDPRVEVRLKRGDHPDVMVIYNDMDPGKNKVKRRAFYLFANLDRLQKGSAPEYVLPRFGDKLEKVPVYTDVMTNAAHLHQELYVIATPERTYSLCSLGHDVADFSLPEYGDWLTAKKLFLFPAAVGADAAGAAAFTAAMAAFAALHSNFTFQPR